MNKKRKVSIAQFKKFFPKISFPLVLSDDSINSFSATSKIFTKEAIESYISIWEKDIDEFTEFIPVAKLKETKNFCALIYWKGALLKHEYRLVTIDKNGNLIDVRSIASTISDGKIVNKSVAKIEEDLIIHILAGANIDHDISYDPKMSKAFGMEIMDDGKILFSEEFLD